MRKFILTATVSLIFVVYIISQRESSASIKLSPPPMLSNIPQSATNTNPLGGIPDNSGATSSRSAAQAAPTAPAQPGQNQNRMRNQGSMAMGQSMGRYKDGTYVGSSVDAYYGNVQVKVTVNGGKIADVQFLDYPQDRRTSQMINSQAMPYLTQEAIVAQSANVQIVSGATDTSQAFQQSLSNALSQAI